MTNERKTVIVTGASQGGAAVANLFIERGYNVVANSRGISAKNELQSSEYLALVDGNIALPVTAGQLVQTALKRFGSIDALVNNAGIFISKSFVEYTAEDFHALASTNLEGFLYVTQSVIKELLAKGRRASILEVKEGTGGGRAAGPSTSRPYRFWYGWKM